MTKEQLNEAYEYVRQHYGIHTKKDFAAAIRVKQAGFYSALNGNEAYLTANLFQKICAAFPGVFNLNYFLDNKGELLAEQPKKVTTNDATADMLEMYAQRLRLVDDIRTSLHEELNTVKDVRGGLEHFSAEFTEIKNTLKQIVKEAQKLNSMRYTTPAYVAGQIVAEDKKPAEVTNPVTSPNSPEQA